MQFQNFLEETGLTHRRFFRWIEWFDDWYESPEELKKVNYREYSTAVIPKVRLILEISRAFGGRIDMEILYEIYHAYDKGTYEIVKGVRLEWEVSN